MIKEPKSCSRIITMKGSIDKELWNAPITPNSDCLNCSHSKVTKSKMKATLFYYCIMVPIMILLMVFLILGEASQLIVDKLQEKLDELQ